MSVMHDLSATEHAGLIRNQRPGSRQNAATPDTQPEPPGPSQTRKLTDPGLMSLDMLIFCDLRVAGCLTSGHTMLSLSSVAFLWSRVTIPSLRASL